MKKAQRIAVFVAAAFLFLGPIPAFAAMEAIEFQMPGKTLSDFQRAYSETKPVIAWQKFQAYKRLQQAPRPTLERSQMREEGFWSRSYSGTKPLAKYMTPHEAMSVEAGESAEFQSASKPIARFVRKAGS